MRMFARNIISGDPVNAGGKALIPEAKRITVRLPRRNPRAARGMVRARPAAILAVEPGLPVLRIRINDATRRAQVLIVLATAGVALLLRTPRQHHGRLID